MQQNNEVVRVLLCCWSYAQVVDSVVDNFVVVGWVVDKLGIVEKRTHVRARFTPIKTYVLHKRFNTQKYIKYMRKCIFIIKLWNLIRGQKVGVIYIIHVFLYINRGYFPKMEIFSREKNG